MVDTLRDQGARDSIAGIGARLDTHEQVCTQRWENSRATMARVEGMVSGLYRRLWMIAGTVIVLLLGICGTLVLDFFVHK